MVAVVAVVLVSTMHHIDIVYGNQMTTDDSDNSGNSDNSDNAKRRAAVWPTFSVIQHYQFHVYISLSISFLYVFFFKRKGRIITIVVVAVIGQVSPIEAQP